ncbi:MAG TPA: protein translocase subunit SecD, partial [Rhodocyclaceae bacterium]|nr:protein translocase subunit SecD [Rhodocyclaceae bacterium]
MNRYPLWLYALVAISLVFGLLYTLPNFYGEVPAVQVSSLKATIKVDERLRTQVEETIKTAGITHDGIYSDPNSVRVRLRDTDTQLKAKDVIEKALNPQPSDPSYVVALNLLSASPRWLTAIGALPMYLGLDLRGGVHFLLQVDLPGAITKRLDATAGDLRTLLRDKNVRHGGISRQGQTVVVRLRDAALRDRARAVIADAQPDLQLVDQGAEGDLRLAASLSPPAIKRIQEFALKQNITTLHNRINELGVA